MKALWTEMTRAPLPCDVVLMAYGLSVRHIFLAQLSQLQADVALVNSIFWPMHVNWAFYVAILADLVWSHNCILLFITATSELFSNPSPPLNPGNTSE